MLSDFAKRETDSLNLAKESKAQVFALKKNQCFCEIKKCVFYMKL